MGHNTKTTGKDKEIYRTGVLVEMKKTLVFYKGRAPKGEKSNWVMHEYRLENKQPSKLTKVHYTQIYTQILFTILDVSLTLLIILKFLTKNISEVKINL